MILQKNKLLPLDESMIDKIRDIDMIHTGSYHPADIAESCSDYFNLPKFPLIIAGEHITKSKVFMLKDYDEKQQMTIMNSLFNYLLIYNHTINSDSFGRYIYTQLANAVEGKPGPTKKLTDFITNYTREYPIVNDTGHVNKKTKILTLLEPIGDLVFGSKYIGSLIADIYNHGFEKIYNDSLLYGPDNDKVISAIAKYKNRQTRDKVAASIREKWITEQNKVNNYRAIIKKKFGSKRLSEIDYALNLQSTLLISAENILGLLTKAERTPVAQEYNDNEKYLEALANNKCGHVKLYKQFRREKNNNTLAKIYTDLKKYFQHTNKNQSAITCKECKFDIMCPHVRDLTELDLAGKTFIEVKSKLSKYISAAGVRQQYFCKICGELLVSSHASGIAFMDTPQSSMDEELKNFMWGEMVIVMKYIKIIPAIKPSKLITAMRDACYQYIFDIEKQIIKSKTSSADEIKEKKRLFITIFAFAYIIHFIQSNRGMVEFRNLKIVSKNPIVDMIKHSISIILIARNVSIREIPGMTTEIIKNKLVDAYKTISTGGRNIVIQSDETEDLVTTLLMDPVYNYLYTINRLNSALNGKKIRQNKFDRVDSIDKVLGKSLSTIEKTTDVFSAANVNLTPVWKISEFHRIINEKPNELLSDKVWRTAYTGYIADSYKLFMEKIKYRLYQELVYMAMSAKKVNTDDIFEVSLRDPFKKYQAKYKDLRRLEKILFRKRALILAKNYCEYDRTPFKQIRNSSITRIYDENGLRHKWDIYITDDGKTLTARDIAKDTESGKHFKSTIVDKKCTKCGILFSSCDKLDVNKIHNAINSNYTIKNFFQFYEHRCPENGGHDYIEGSSKCTKCKYVVGMNENITSQDSMNYYREYRNVYESEREEIIAANTVVEAPKPQIEKKKDYTEVYAEWTFNFNIVLELSNKLKIVPRLISALGATEHQDYMDIVSGSFIPLEPETRNDTRIFVLDSHIKNLFTEYNQLRYFHKLVKPTTILTQIVDASGINKHRIAELSKQLPDVYHDYNTKFNYFHKNKKPNDILSFEIQSLCEICLEIWNHADKDTEKMRHDFVEYYVKKIIRADELFSRAGYFNWSLLYGDKQTRETDTGSGEKQYDAEDNSDEDDIDPLSKDGFDVEEDPDREPMDEEDNDNEWKVGDDMGL